MGDSSIKTLVSTFTPLKSGYNDSKDWILEWMRTRSAFIFIYPDSKTKDLINDYYQPSNILIDRNELDYKSMIQKCNFNYNDLKIGTYNGPLLIWVDCVPLTEYQWEYCQHLIIHNYNLPYIMRLTRKANNFWELLRDKNMCIIS